MNTQQSLSFLDNADAALALSRPPPGVEAELTGTEAVSTPAIVEQIEQRNVTTVLGVVFVFGLLLVYYRNPLRAVAPLVPMVFGFSALTLSPFPITADFGSLTVGVIFLTLVAALTTLPPTLIVLGRVSDALQSLPGVGEPTEITPRPNDD